MVARRKEAARGKSGEEASEKAHVNGKAPADFFPPGFGEDIELPPVKEGDVVTYFVNADKKGLELYGQHAIKYHHDGYRAVMLGPPTFTFDRAAVALVGRARGDHFLKAVEWAKSNPLKDLHAKYLLAGGGTPAQREAVLRKYERAKTALAAHDEKRKALEDALDEASVALVERFGKSPLQLDGALHDPTYVRERVYWKKRTGA
jgi:hypothetical protein